MAVFGVPTPHEDDALRAVRAAADMRDGARASQQGARARRTAPPSRAGPGVNTGEVVAGDATRTAGAVVGDAVNVAARLEQAAAPGEILIGEATHALVRDAVAAEPVEPLELKGKAEPVSPSDWSSVTPRRRRRAAPRLAAGRAAHASSRSCGRRSTTPRPSASATLFTVLGAAGVGQVAARRRVPSTLDDRRDGRCGPLPRLRRGHHLLARRRDRPAGAASARTTRPAEPAEAIAGALPRRRRAGVAADALAGLVGLGLRRRAPPPRRPSGPPAGSSRRSPARARWSSSSTTSTGPSRRCSTSSTTSSDWTRDAPILLLCMARPELLDDAPGWGGGKLNATTSLEPLTEADADELIENLLGGTLGLPVGVRASVAAAEGNPLFVEEMLRHAHRRRRLVGRRLLAGGAATSTRSPCRRPSRRCSRRVSTGSDPDERALLERASVGARTSRARSRAIAADPARERVGAHLHGAGPQGADPSRRRGSRPTDAFRFRHMLIRDAAYDALTKAERGPSCTSVRRLA